MNTNAKKKLNWGTLIAVAVLSAILPLTATGDNGDPPGRVARIRYVQGSVSFDPAGESDWVPAVTNRPMTIGDQIWADASSRAEVQVGSAMIRMDQNTGFSFLNLDDRTVQIQLTDGTLDLQVHRLHNGEVFEVDTPNQAFTVTQPGRYRLQVGTDGTSSMVTVRQGHGQVTGGGRSYDLNAGQGGTFTGTDTLDGQVAAVGDPDDFDNWGSSRDRQYDGSRSARYVSPDVVGYEDLDANGTWNTDPTYGNVWTPTSVQTGWAPYRNGHWVWVSPWGWTWVDDAPWGYAPFHYGRWVSLRGRWGWVPGPVNVQPVYAPALVAFIGGPNFGVSISAGGGGGNVGWFPLGPREVYVPSYATSRGYMERVNTSNTRVNTTTITNVYNNQVTNNSTINNVTYVNRTVPGAVTAVPQNAFRSSAPVARAAVQMNEKQIAAVPVVARAAVAPTRESVLGNPNPSATRMAQPPAAVVNRPVVAKATPPPPPVPFAKQQQELAKHPGQPLAPHEVQALRPAAVATAHPMVKQAPPAKPATLDASHPANQTAVGNAKPPANTPLPNQQANKPGNMPVANAPGNQPPVRSDRPASAQQQQAAQQQAAQQQAAEKARQQQAQSAQQQAADKARQQQAQQQAEQQAAQQQHRPPSAQPAPSQQTAQQQQQADKARQQQAAQQQAAQQQAQQQAAQHRPPSAQPAPPQQTAQQQQQADKARQQQAAQQQAAQQQAQQQAAQHRPPSAQPASPQQTAQQQQQADKGAVSSRLHSNRLHSSRRLKSPVSSKRFSNSRLRNSRLPRRLANSRYNNRRRNSSQTGLRVLSLLLPNRQRNSSNKLTRLGSSKPLNSRPRSSRLANNNSPSNRPPPNNKRSVSSRPINRPPSIDHPVCNLLRNPGCNRPSHSRRLRIDR